ncbi:META domain-containing protein [Actinomycetaceae bacterium WB03_NA08]|uniref:META domain-containing protein n=1 Tax=Scrofimicrobium canadense TaxID=2652290 RepID=A0A6N7VTQ9_9ACTO|nr:META domain-containing protein [Scrofimicrobium canadense]MSS85159.1 META domain-containing protein [Scrofimicrobium canadense]
MKRMYVGGVVAALVGMSIVGCGGSAATLTQEKAVGSWTLQSGKGPDGDIAIVSTNPITLDIDADGTITGSSGCNNLMSSMEVSENGAVTLPEAGGALTLMACEEPVMKAESAFMQTLDGVTKGSIKGSLMTLEGDNGTLVFEKIEPQS